MARIILIERPICVPTAARITGKVDVGSRKGDSYVWPEQCLCYPQDTLVSKQGANDWSKANSPLQAATPSALVLMPCAYVVSSTFLRMGAI